LFFSALVPYKKADLAIEACQKARKKLFVLGGGPELKRLKKMAHPDFIKFIERPSDDEVIEHFSKARALIFPAVEDFGIIPVEALSAGLPVIGLKEGGLLDSQDDQTCEFFGEQTTDSLISAISRFENRASCGDFAPELLRKKAQEFSNENFEKKIIQSLKSFSSQNFLD
jgi:glycosyltransferase involved in cell wall biosynthesis